MQVKFETKCDLCGKTLPVGSEAEGQKDYRWFFYCSDCSQIRGDANKLYDALEGSEKNREIKKELRKYISDHQCQREIAEAAMYRKYFAKK